MMAGLFLRTLSVAVMVTVVLLPLLLGRRWLEARYAAQTRWLVWLGVAAVLLVAPFLPRTMAPVQVEVPVRTVAFTQTEAEATGIAVEGAAAGTVAVPGQSVQPTDFTPAAPVETAPTPVSYRSVDWTELAAALWLAGAALLAVVQALRYAFTRRRLLRASRPLDREDGVELRVLPGLESPVTIGFLRPVVLLPSAETEPMALRHELTHIKRRDTWGKGLLFLACALYWFHPLVWLMARQADRDVEAACDAQMAKTLAPEERKAYGVLLLAAAGGGRDLPFATRFGGSKEQMKARLTQLFRPGKSSRALVCGLLAAAVLASGLVACREKSSEELPDGVYCSPYANVTWPVGDPDAEGEDYTVIQLSLLNYDETGPHGKPLGEYTLPLARELMLRQLWWGEDQKAGEQGTQEWQQAVSSFLNWPMFRNSLPLGTDYLVVTVKDGEVIRLSWAMVGDGDALYTSGNYGFTLQLPESWAWKYAAWEGEGEVSFYRAEDARLLCQVLIDPASILEPFRSDSDPSGYAGVVSDTTMVLCETEDWLYRLRIPHAEEYDSQYDTPQEAETYREMLQEAWEMGENGDRTFHYNGDMAAPAYTQAADALRQVLAGELPFQDRESGEARYIDDLGEVGGQPVKVLRYAMIDMDGDGVDELVLWLLRGEGEYSLGSYVLRWQEGQVDGWHMGFRAMNLLTLKADGTYGVSYSGDHWGYGTMDFTGETESGTKEYTYCRGNGSGVEYFVQGMPVTREDFYAEIDREDAKPDPVWYDAATGARLNRMEDLSFVVEPETYWLELVQGEQAEMQRLVELSSYPDLDRDGIRYFSAEELTALNYGYGNYTYQEGLEFAPINDAPDSREELVRQLYNQFVPELADQQYNFTLLGQGAPCLFADGKMWHRVTYWDADVHWDYDWDTFTVLEDGEDRVTYQISGYADFNDPQALKTRQFTLTRETEGDAAGLWRYSERT